MKVYLSHGDVSFPRWWVVLSTQSMKFSWNVQAAMSCANCLFPDFSPLKEEKRKRKQGWKRQWDDHGKALA